MEETEDFLLALNAKHDIVQLPFNSQIEKDIEGNEFRYFELKPNERLFILGYTVHGIFIPPLESNIFTPMEQYFYKIGGMQLSFLKDKHFRDDTQLFRVYAYSGFPPPKK